MKSSRYEARKRLLVTQTQLYSLALVNRFVAWLINICIFIALVVYDLAAIMTMFPVLFTVGTVSYALCREANRLRAKADAMEAELHRE